MNDVDDEIARLARKADRLARAQDASNFVLLLVLVAVVAFCVWGATQLGRERAACVERGGRVEQVHGAYGGWVCVGGAP